MRSEPKWTCFRTMVVCVIRLFIDANPRPILPQETNTKFTLPTILPAPSLTVLKACTYLYFFPNFCKISTLLRIWYICLNHFITIAVFDWLMFHKFYEILWKFCWFFLIQNAFDKSSRLFLHKKTKYLWKYWGWFFLIFLFWNNWDEFLDKIKSL